MTANVGGEPQRPGGAPRQVPAAGEEHRRVLAREFLASTLYLTLVLLAALVAVPVDRLPSDERLVWVVLGTSLGLLLAHWFAFRLATRITTEQGAWSPSAAREAGAQLSGGLCVALLAAAPFVLLDGSAALWTSLLLLAALPAVAGLLVARLGGRTWVFAVTTGVVTLVVALAVVVLKNFLGH